MSSEDAKPVKSEVDDDENDEKSLSSLLKNKNKKPNGIAKLPSLKNEVDDDDNDEKSLSSILKNKPKKPNSTKSLSLKDAKLKKSESKVKKEEQSDDDFTPKKKTPNNDKPKKEVTGSAETVGDSFIFIFFQLSFLGFFLFMVA